MAVLNIPKFARWLTVIVYFAVVLIPVLLLGTDGPWLSGGDAEIRPKAPFPKKLSPGTFRDFDEWFADRVGLRYPLIYVGSELHVGLLRRPLDRHIFFGRNGWMFWTDDAESVTASAPLTLDPSDSVAIERVATMFSAIDAPTPTLPPDAPSPAGKARTVEDVSSSLAR